MTFAKCIFYKKNGLVCIAPEWKILKSVQCIGGEKTCWNGLCNLLSERSAVIKPLGMVESNLRKTLQIKEKFWEIAHLPAVVCDGKISVPHLNILEFDVKLYEN